jgi:signal transduction histidine kinase
MMGLASQQPIRRGTGGSGLGLNIVYNLVTGLLGGTITLRSSEGNGCAFTILFPAHLPEQVDAPNVS